MSQFQNRLFETSAERVRRPRPRAPRPRPLKIPSQRSIAQGFRALVSQLDVNTRLPFEAAGQDDRSYDDSKSILQASSRQEMDEDSDAMLIAHLYAPRSPSRGRQFYKAEGKARRNGKARVFEEAVRDIGTKRRTATPFAVVSGLEHRFVRTHPGCGQDLHHQVAGERARPRSLWSWSMPPLSISSLN